MASLIIDSIRTMNQFGDNATMFQPFSDALTLTMDLTASPDLAAGTNAFGFSFEAIFQIIGAASDTVIVQQTWHHGFEWGRYFWISQGNNWGPAPTDYTTPEKWELTNFDPQVEMYGFRGIIKCYENLPVGLRPLDAFDISPIRWFRVARLAVG
jgi:hypothetical protein